MTILIKKLMSEKLFYKLIKKGREDEAENFNWVCYVDFRIEYN
jgi:hypothetical protein